MNTSGVFRNVNGGPGVCLHFALDQLL